MLRTHAAMVAAFLLASAACSSDDTSQAALAGAAERVRRLSFVAVPPIDRETPEEYARSSASDAAAMTEEHIAELRGVFGRLGYFSADDDLRAATAGAASYYAAFYFDDTKRITVIGEPRPSLVVHELVHALQDQHFDLTAFKGAAHTTDEALARRAMIEGDAQLAQLWYEAERTLSKPESFLAPYVTDGLFAKAMADHAWENAPSAPPLFAARAAFVYGYGARYVAQRMGMPAAPSRAPLDFGARDAAFRDPPQSAQEVIAGPREDDPIVEVGLRALPRSASDAYAVLGADRLGEWYIRILAKAAATATLPAASVSEMFPPMFEPQAWDGDQLVVLAARGGDGKASGPPLAVVWTSAWDTPDAAAGFAYMLARLHRVPASTEVERRWEGTAADGEPTHLRVEGERVVFVKNLDETLARDIAEAAMGKIPPSAFSTMTTRELATPQRLP